MLGRNKSTQVAAAAAAAASSAAALPACPDQFLEFWVEEERSDVEEYIKRKM